MLKKLIISRGGETLDKRFIHDLNPKGGYHEKNIL